MDNYGTLRTTLRSFSFLNNGCIENNVYDDKPESYNLDSTYYQKINRTEWTNSTNTVYNDQLLIKAEVDTYTKDGIDKVMFAKKNRIKRF